MLNKKITRYTQRRIFVIIALLALAGFSAFYIYYNYSVAGVENLMNAQKIDNLSLLQNIIKFKSAGLTTYSKDYTYWDEMVSFSHKPDTNWAKVNIVESLPTYEADFVWVFDSSYNKIYFTRSEDAEAIDTTLINTGMLLTNCDEKRFNHFFIRAGDNIIEISSASIHPSTDPERLTSPEGYFAAGRLWNKKMFQKISELSGSEIIITDKKFDEDSRLAKNFIIINYLELKDYDNKTVSLLRSSNEYTSLKVIHSRSNIQYIVTISLIFIIISVTGISLYYLVNKPLKNITAALHSGNTAFIKGLMKKKNEFGNLARVIYDFNRQKERLITEIEERIEAENKMLITEEKLKGSLAEKEVLIKEVHHRVKNNLQIIISLIRLQTNRLDDKNIINHLNDILNRIKSIALVHELLYRSHDLSHIDLDEYLLKIIDSLKLIFNGRTGNIAFNVSAKGIFLSVDKAVPCAIIINELITNSIKHAFKGHNHNEININFEKSNSGYLLKVSDNGIGIPADLDISKAESLGMHLVSSLADQLDASIWVNGNKGTTFTIKIPEN